MRKSKIAANFRSNIESVWNVVTDNTSYGWRSDLAKIEIVNDKIFIEHTKNGFQTEFEIITKIPYKRYEFNMKNNNMSGHWVGTFTMTSTGTSIEFIEEIEIKNPVMRILSYLFMNIKKMQITYINDLRKALGEVE